VSEPVPVALIVAVMLELIVEEPVPESDPVFEGLAPLVRLAVGVRVKDFERLCVELAVDDGDGVPVVVTLAVGVIEDEKDSELETLGESETVSADIDDGVFDVELDINVSEGVPLADTPRMSVDAAELVEDDDWLLADEKGSLLVGVCDGLNDDVGGAVSIEVTLLVAVALGLGIFEPLSEAERLLDEDAPFVILAEGVAEVD
jgi:hypothetical protein